MTIAAKIWMAMKLLFILVTVLVFVLNAVIGILDTVVFHWQPIELRRKLEPGVGLVITQDREYLSDMDEVVVSDTHVYVLYSWLQLVKVYDLDGSYTCSFAVHCTERRNADMFVCRDTLYLVSEDCIVYEYTNNAFVRSYNDEDSNTLLTHLNKNKWHFKNIQDGDQNLYYIKGQSVIRRDSTGAESVFVKRSPLYFIVSSQLQAGLNALSVILFVILFAMLNMGKRQQ